MARRLTTLTVIALAGATLIAGCSATGDPASATAGGPAPGAAALEGAGPTSITLWHGLGGAGGAALESAVEEFNRTNPDQISATAVYQGNYADTQAKYGAAIRDNTTPDVMLVSDIGTGYMHDAGQTVTAQDLAAANPDDLDLDDLREVARNYYSSENRLLSVPFNVSMPMLYVNNDLLTRAGISDPASLTTFDAVAAAARAVHATDPSTAGLGLWMNGWVFEQISASAGAEYCAPENGRGPDGATEISLSSPAQKAALSSLTDLARTGDAVDVGTSGDNNTNAFLQKKTAMMINGSGAAANVAKGADFAYTALPMPRSTSDPDGGSVIGGASLWVSRVGHTEAQQVAAWKLVSFLASPKTQEAFSHATGFQPVNTQVDASPTHQQYLAGNAVAASVANAFATTRASTVTAGCLTGALTGVRDNVVSAMQSVFAGRTALEDGLAEATTAANATIDAYREQVGK